MRKKINITIDETTLSELQREAEEKNLSLSRLIENKLKEIETADLEARLKKLEEKVHGKSIAKAMERKL